MPFLEPVTLRGPHASLVPLSPDHHDALVEAVSDGELWNLWYTAVPKPETMAKEIERRLGLFATGSMLPFTVLDADGRVAGMTTYMNVDAANRRVEIGSTWYAKRVQRSALNTQCKRLLLAHAFEVMDCIAVEFRRISSTIRAAAPSSGSGPSRTASCAATRSRRTARCGIPSSTASSPPNGRRCGPISTTNCMTSRADRAMAACRAERLMMTRPGRQTRWIRSTM